MSRIACILPGIGYTCDRPLLYYSARLARAAGWETVPVPYGGFPPKVRGDEEKMRQSAEMALAQTEAMLRSIQWDQYEEILFISKSVGTVAAAAYAHIRRLPCRHILFTPVEATFSAPIPHAIAFHGAADPWVATETLKALCGAAHIPLYITENANHSLETGDVARDIAALAAVMARAEEYMRGGMPCSEIAEW